MHCSVASFQDQGQAPQIQVPTALEVETLKTDVARQWVVYLHLEAQRG